MGELDKKVKINNIEYDMTRYELLRTAMALAISRGEVSLEELMESKFTDEDKLKLITQYHCNKKIK